MSNRLLNAIREISVSSAEAMKPADIFFGVVESASPLVIGIDQKLKLTGEVLILTGAVSNHSVRAELPYGYRDAFISDFDGTSGSCRIRMDLSDEDITFKTNLEKGEKVILLRALGGQKYIVLDRVVSE